MTHEGPVDPTAGQGDEDQALAAVTERLSARFPDTAPIDVQTVVADVHAGMAGAKVRSFVPVLVEKAARRRLQNR